LGLLLLVNEKPRHKIRWDLQHIQVPS
jgi:hypothetical protein